MGDYTNGQITVYTCPPEQAHVFLSFIDEHRMTLDWAESSAEFEDRQKGWLMFGQTYGDNDTSVGALFNADLVTGAPDAVWTAWLDPKYEIGGNINIHAPGLGLFDGECTSDGDVILTQHELKELLDSQPEDMTVGELREILGARTGQPWLDAIAAVQEPRERVLARGEDPFTATITPQAWVDDEAVEVDPPGQTEWDCTEFVTTHWDYFADLVDATPLREYQIDGVVDRDDVFRADPAAPQWVRDWTGPFVIRIGV